MGHVKIEGATCATNWNSGSRHKIVYYLLIYVYIYRYNLFFSPFPRGLPSHTKLLHFLKLMPPRGFSLSSFHVRAFERY